MQDESKLQELYQSASKHSNYQIIPSDLEKYLNNDKIDVKSRNEKERLKYFSENINVNNKSILDIGGNTGYFTFELLKQGAAHVDYYEGNNVHAEFVKEASKILQFESQLKVHTGYFLFEEVQCKKKYDVIFLLNVLHHIGDDYGDSFLSKEKALESITTSLKNLAYITDILVFQLGFNWKGERNSPFFKNGTKKEMIGFVKKAIGEFYDIVSIGIAEIDNKNIIYNEVNGLNIERQDELGEFLNRPIFILKTHVQK